MPASVYHQHVDPATGQTFWIPQLYPHATYSGEIASGEMEAWVMSGAIPRELYEEDKASMKKRDELTQRLQRGEQVMSSEFPPPGKLIDYMIKNKGRLYGENVLKRMFSRLEETDSDIVWLSFVKEAITCIATQDPLSIHFHIARKILKDEYSIEDSHAVDQLSRALVEGCEALSKLPALNHPVFAKVSVEVSDLSDHLKHEKEGILQLDADFLSYLSRQGAKGKKLAAETHKACKEIYEYYEINNFPGSYRLNVWSLWVTKDSITNIALEMMAKVLWEDRCKRFWDRKEKGFPSVAKPVIDRMIPILSPKKGKKFIETEGSVICVSHEGHEILKAPAVDAAMITAFQKGVNELSTLTGHKLIRWQVNTGYEQWASGKNDHRLIDIDGGYSRIAELAKCTSKTDIAKIKEILHAQAHGQFIFPDGTHGNMIVLRVEDKYRNNEPSKIRMILGDMLHPEYVCQSQRGDRRLVPIGELPPLHGSPNSHASQAQLQLLVFREFSNQSMRLAQDGSVLITEEQWKQLAKEAGLSPDKVDLVVNYWCQPDLFNCFLERQGDEFRLASYYDKAQQFLEDQGHGRLINSERGRKSAEKRSKAREKS